MRRVPSEASAVERARWLGDLHLALEEAQRLAWTIGNERGDAAAMELYGRIETVLAEVRSLRIRAGVSGRRDDLDWMEPHPWSP